MTFSAKNGQIKKVLLHTVPYILFFIFFNKMGELVRLAEGSTFLERLIYALGGISGLLQDTSLSYHPKDLLTGIMGAAAVWLAVYLKKKNAKKYRHNEEYGSACWGTSKDIQPYMDSKPENNIILTQTEGLTMNGRPKEPKYARNKNVLVIGGSGSGKTRFFVKPNLCQCHSSFVVTDPKGSLLIECGEMLRKNGYEIKVFNTINFKRSMKYNPFAYVHSEKDILKLVNVLMENTKGEDSKGGDDFWSKAESMLYQALIGYIWYESPKEEQNFDTLVKFINSMEVKEDDEDYRNAVDLIFEELAEREPDHFAVRQYKKYKLAAGKTAKSILISCGARLAPFDIKEIRDLTMEDEMELDLTGDRKTAVFVVISDTDTTFNFLVSMLYTQLFNQLCDRADNVYDGRLPVHVRCILDEFANIGKIPRFEKLIATIRSREISACVILQAQSQLKAIYKDNADTIVGNCDSMLFLGGKEKTTLKEVSEMLGKATIDMYNTSVTKGNQESHGQNFQKLGRELLSQDELAVMDGGKCILQIRGVRPFFSSKYDLTRHSRYQELADFDKKNTFDVERYITLEPDFQPNEQADTYVFSESDFELETKNNLEVETV